MAEAPRFDSKSWLPLEREIEDSGSAPDSMAAVKDARSFVRTDFERRPGGGRRQWTSSGSRRRRERPWPWRRRSENKSEEGEHCTDGQGALGGCARWIPLEYSAKQSEISAEKFYGKFCTKSTGLKICRQTLEIGICRQHFDFVVDRNNEVPLVKVPNFETSGRFVDNMCKPGHPRVIPGNRPKWFSSSFSVGLISERYIPQVEVGVSLGYPIDSQSILWSKLDHVSLL